MVEEMGDKMVDKSDSITRKFVDSAPVSDWDVETDTGWQPVTHVNKTVPYGVWRVVTDQGTILECADTHILITTDRRQVFAKDSLNECIATVAGGERVISVENLGYDENMYDLSVDSHDHTYYTNGLLSHNTTVAAGYLLWYAMFNEDATVLIAAHKYDGAQEIMHRVRYAYESVPDHIRAGVKEYNKRSMVFDNGSRIVASTTSETTGRGMSLSLIYCLGGENTVTVRDKITGEIKDIALSELYSELG